MNKFGYVDPKMEIINFMVADIITTSGEETENTDDLPEIPLD